MFFSSHIARVQSDTILPVQRNTEASHLYLSPDILSLLSLFAKCSGQNRGVQIYHNLDLDICE